LDDSQREEYKPVFRELDKLGFKELTISDIKPFSFVKEQSTIFYRTNNLLDI
jgi:hypothetical protein